MRDLEERMAAVETGGAPASRPPPRRGAPPSRPTPPPTDAQPPAEPPVAAPGGGGVAARGRRAPRRPKRLRKRNTKAPSPCCNAPITRPPRRRCAISSRAALNTTSRATHGISGNAWYWLGETHYARRDYERAAVAFARGYRGFPAGRKAPDNLLKLGMSWAALGQTEDACATFAKLRNEHGDAPALLLDRLAGESARAGCP